MPKTFKFEMDTERLLLSTQVKALRKEEIKWAHKARKAANKHRSRISQLIDGHRESLFQQRKYTLRPMARAMHVANAFLAGMKYVEVENKIVPQNFGGVGGVKNSIAENHEEFWNEVLDYVCSFSNFKRENIEEKLLVWRNEHPQYKEWLLENKPWFWVEPEKVSWSSTLRQDIVG